MIFCFSSFFAPRFFKTLLPFQRQHTFFEIIARLAAGDEIIFCGSAASRQGNQMVHGNIVENDIFTAVMAKPGGSFLLPPAGFS